MDLESLENYLRGAQSLSRRLEQDPGALQELLHLIEETKDSFSGDHALEEFFKAEYAFYNGHYEIALKHYFAAKGMTHYEFYCFRASAFVLKTQGNFEKAASLIEKALDIVPDDYFSSTLLGNLSSSSYFMEEAAPYLAGPLKKVPYPGRTKGQNSLTSFFEGFKKIESDAFSHAEVSFDDLFEDVKQIPHELAKAYLATSHKKRNYLPEQCLCVIGPNMGQALTNPYHFNMDLGQIASLMANYADARSSALYLRWNGKGIAINPGKHFIKDIHRLGLSVFDIDLVILTHSDPRAYVEIHELFALTEQLKLVQESGHIIHYYLQEKAYQELCGSLKKTDTENQVLHRLELHFANPEKQKLELTDDISLAYFSLSLPLGLPDSVKSTESHPSLEGLGIRLELKEADKNMPRVNIGYASPFHYTPLLSQYFGVCDILVIGVGELIRCQDAQLQDADGVSKAALLANELLPKIFLCTDLGGVDGGTRLEFVKKLRTFQMEHKPESRALSLILPADAGFLMDLHNYQVKSSLTGMLIDPKNVHIACSGGIFGPLNYLSDEHQL